MGENWIHAVGGYFLYREETHFFMGAVGFSQDCRGAFEPYDCETKARAILGSKTWPEQMSIAVDRA